MTKGRKQTVLGLSIVSITKCLMERYSIDHESAYRKVAATHFFELLNDPDTGLYLEPDKYLRDACLLELEQGQNAMYQFINAN